VRRGPDVEVTVHLGDDPSVEPAGKTGASPALAGTLKSLNGPALLDLGASRVELRGDADSGADMYGSILRVQSTVFFKQADKDASGYVDENEAKGTFMAGAFAAMDRDGDGKVTEAEFNAYQDLLTDLHARLKKACVTVVLSDESRGLFDLLDANRDGRLSVREMRAAPALLATLDKDGKGIARADLPRTHRLTVRHGPAVGGSDDYSAVLLRLYGGNGASYATREPSAGPLWFRKMDKNRDGDVSRREWLGTDAQFRAIDTDGDGLLSAAEAERFDAKHRKGK